jgi:hypothetical protein
VKNKIHFDIVRYYILVIPCAIMLLFMCSAILTVRADSINPGLYPVDSKPFGLAFPQWSEKWWQWMVSIPQPQNPLNDNTGKNCGEG